MPRLRMLIAVVGCALLVSANGCLLGVLLPEPINLPAALVYALSHADELSPGADHPLAEVEAGTPIDDLHTLDGCWGVAERMESPTSPPRSLDVYQVLRFDAAAGTLVRYTYQNLFDFGTEVMIQRGTYTAAGPGLLRFRATRIEANMFGVIVDVSDRYTPPLAYEVRATLDDDGLKTLWELPDDPFTPAGFADGLPFIFTRIDCP